jgi:outer membrane protein OmpA-like peptidoglycan-associated protein
MKKIILLLVSLLYLSNIYAQNKLDDCIEKVTSNWGAGCKGCDAKEEDAFFVILQNKCKKNIDIVIALQEPNLHWLRFEKLGVAAKDTMRAFVCKSYKGKYQFWFKESGDASLLPTYDEINKDFYLNNPHLIKKKKVLNPIESISLKLLIGDINKKPLVNQTVHYRNSDGIKQTTITNIDGDFVMNKLDGDSKLDIELEKNPNLDSHTKVTLANKKGETISEMNKNSEGTFKYSLLPSDLITLAKLETEEVVIKKKDKSLDDIKDFANSTEKELKVKRQVTYASGSAELSESAQKELDGISKILNENPTLQLEIIAHTDARGDDATNLALSEKRAANSINYLIGKGIKTERLKSKGMGEKEILNQCKNGINCSEEEHAVNRRTEFRFLKN